MYLAESRASETKSADLNEKLFRGYCFELQMPTIMYEEKSWVLVVIVSRNKSPWRPKGKTYHVLNKDNNYIYILLYTIPRYNSPTELQHIHCNKNSQLTFGFKTKMPEHWRFSFEKEMLRSQSEHVICIVQFYKPFFTRVFVIFVLSVQFLALYHLSDIRSDQIYAEDPFLLAFSC